MRFRAYLLAGVMVMGLFALSLDLTPPQPREWNIDPVQTNVGRYSNQRSALSLQLQYALLADSLTSLLARERPEGGFLLSPHADGTVDGAVWMERAGREAIQEGSPARLGVFVVSSRAYRQPNQPRGPSDPFYLVGSHDGIPYCLSVHLTSDGDYVVPAPTAGNVHLLDVEMLGICAWVARYGVPGDAVSTLLRQTRGAVAFPPAELEPWMVTRYSRRLGIAVVDHCRQGSRDRCLRTFEGTLAVADRLPEWEGTPAGSVDLLVEPWWRLAEPHWNGLLVELEEEFGQEAMRRFWRSDEPVASSFRSAFGEDAAEWYRGRLTRIYGPLQAGPGARLRHVLLALALAAAGLWVGSGQARRRRAG